MGRGGEVSEEKLSTRLFPMSYGHCANKMYESSPAMGRVGITLEEKVGGGKYRIVDCMHYLQCTCMLHKELRNQTQARLML
jgi:hypothetical protein